MNTILTTKDIAKEVVKWKEWKALMADVKRLRLSGDKLFAKGSAKVSTKVSGPTSTNHVANPTTPRQ